MEQYFCVVKNDKNILKNFHKIEKKFNDKGFYVYLWGNSFLYREQKGYFVFYTIGNRIEAGFGCCNPTSFYLSHNFKLLNTDFNLE